MKRMLLLAAVPMALLSANAPAFASFHVMQIEQVIGGVDGNTTQQAIQLRMRVQGQNFMLGSRLVVWNASGANPVTIITFPDDVIADNVGSRILIVSSAFAGGAHGPAADFLMTNLIPASYLAAGRLTFEGAGGTIYWSLSWGGGNYTGPTTGDTTNDADGDFGPSFGSALPSGTTQALRFNGIASALSTNNAADYSVTSESAVFTNNTGQNGTVPVELMEFIVE